MTAAAVDLEHGATERTAMPDPHIAGCALCRRQLAAAQPFHEDLCHMDIAPDAERGDGPVIQCPHITVPGHRSKICQHHLERACDQWRNLTARTAPFN